MATTYSVGYDPAFDIRSRLREISQEVKARDPSLSGYATKITDLKEQLATDAEKKGEKIDASRRRVKKEPIALVYEVDEVNHQVSIVDIESWFESDPYSDLPFAWQDGKPFN